MLYFQVWYLKLTVGTPLYRMSSFTSFFAEASILKTLKLPTSNNSALGETIKVLFFSPKKSQVGLKI